VWPIGWVHIFKYIFIEVSKIVSGVINVYKEKGYTSHDVVAIIRKLLGRVKTGHTGTLDPQAEGVLPICVGRATKLAGFLTASDKSYQAELILGMTTDTCDHTGQVLATAPVNVDMPAIQQAIRFFEGKYMQMPPMYSAIRIEGKKLYELARAGKTVERKPRPVEISRIDIVDAQAVDAQANHRLLMDIDCSKGTYIRSLCVDIGDTLGCGGCMGDLVRTRSGAFCVDTAIRLSELKQAVEAGRSDFLIPPDQALPAPMAVLTEMEFFKKTINGHPVPLAKVTFENSKAIPEGEYCWLYADGASPLNGATLIGLYILKAGILRSEVMMYADTTQ